MGASVRHPNPNRPTGIKYIVRRGTVSPVLLPIVLLVVLLVILSVLVLLMNMILSLGRAISRPHQTRQFFTKVHIRATGVVR
jgi:hypothetical protein